MGKRTQNFGPSLSVSPSQHLDVVTNSEAAELHDLGVV